ncbi:ethionine resistance protein [Elasticomyces elasticus]|nr:ethionine resistance protein [Elasticomyces elasticus]
MINTNTEQSQHEQAPLLPKKHTEDESTTTEEEGDLADILPEDETPQRTLILHEFWVLLKSSIPTISILIVGRASPQDLSTAAFSYMFAMCSAWLIGMGGTTALDTLASATFTGSKNKHDLGTLLQRAFVVLTLFYLPV